MIGSIANFIGLAFKLLWIELSSRENYIDVVIATFLKGRDLKTIDIGTMSSMTGLQILKYFFENINAGGFCMGFSRFKEIVTMIETDNMWAIYSATKDIMSVYISKMLEDKCSRG